MQEHWNFVITDYEKELFDKMDYYHVATPEEKERLRKVYEEVTSEAVCSKRGSNVNGKGMAYYYATYEKYQEMRKKLHSWWSDVLSATVGND
ncbi:MAG: hypothetical protein J5881_02830 [Clostridia bacterium]|nr:hypothetical protein [Clostridia bacterium]